MNKVLTTQNENKLTGDTLTGDVSGLSGDIDDAALTATEREAGIDIVELIASR